MRRTFTLLVAVATIALMAPASAGDDHDEHHEVELDADLSSANEVPPSGTTGHGDAEVDIDLEDNTLCVKVEAEDLAGAVVAGHIHVGAAGVNGGVVVDLGVRSSEHETCMWVDGGTLAAIAANPAGYYINIHTTAVPSGEIRGQLSDD